MGGASMSQLHALPLRDCQLASGLHRLCGLRIKVQRLDRLGHRHASLRLRRKLPAGSSVLLGL